MKTKYQTFSETRQNVFFIFYLAIPTQWYNSQEASMKAVAKPARLLVMLCKYLCVHGPRKQSISKEMNNDNDLKFA